MAEESVAASSKLIYVIPRIRISGTAFRQERFTVSKAEFIPDEPKSWDEVIGLPRPQWLDIYRQFPYLNSDEPPEPSRGTLVISSDEAWLRRHISRLLAVVYVMGLEENHWEVPADAFQYSSFQAHANPHDLVTLYTKRGGKTEDLKSLKLQPPLELRGVSGSYRVDLRSERHVELIRRFNENPYDRLGAACYHLFRSQFDNPLVAPPEHDAAAFCACLEAAIDVEGSEYSKQFIDHLHSLYGDHPALSRWIIGLYSERSLFNHGVSEEPTPESSDERLRALVEFRDRTLNWDVLRRMCLDVIENQLQDSIDAGKRELSRLMSPMRTMLRQFFDSEELWNEIAKPFTATQSVQTILAFSGKEHDDFIELCCSFLNGHRWEAMKGKADTAKVLKVLMAMGAVLHEKAKAAGMAEDSKAGSDLYDAADAKDLAAVELWARKHATWAKLLAAQDIGDAAKAVAAHTAKLFVIERR
jgi:hypothetical protein